MQRTEATFRHGILFLCGLTIAYGSALPSLVWALPCATILTALCIPLILKPTNTPNSGEAALKAFFDLRFALFFWAFATAVGYGNMGTLDFRIWFQQAHDGYLPAMLALLSMMGAFFQLLGLFPFHSNKVDLLGGGHPLGALTLSLGHLFFLGSLLYRNLSLEFFPTQWVLSDTPLALGCLAAFLVFALSALDQRTINRLLGFLIIGAYTPLVPLLHCLNFSKISSEYSILCLAFLSSIVLGSLLIYFAYVPLSANQRRLDLGKPFESG